MKSFALGLGTTAAEAAADTVSDSATDVVEAFAVGFAAAAAAKVRPFPEDFAFADFLVVGTDATVEAAVAVTAEAAIAPVGTTFSAFLVVVVAVNAAAGTSGVTLAAFRGTTNSARIMPEAAVVVARRPAASEAEVAADLGLSTTSSSNVSTCADDLCLLFLPSLGDTRDGKLNDRFPSSFDSFLCPDGRVVRMRRVTWNKKARQILGLLDLFHLLP